MDNKKFKATIIKVLKQDSRLWDEKSKELNQTLLKDLIDKLDEKLIDLLLNNEETKDKFFIKIKDVFVLKQNDLKFFLDENKLDNSYTQYKNKIGLRIGNKLLSERNEVVLDWPFKDCVLEGGMTKEDQKRNEIFFNEILAKDEIDRLFDPKALVNWKRYTAKGEEKVKELKRDKDGTIKENLIIRGNNLLALHSLKEQFTGKIKLIYIDPPYNTGNDSFKYNDNFNHSTWLTFMKNRLEIAKELLRNDGVIFLQCDDNEQAYLKVLMDDIFERNNFICNMIRIAKTGGGHDSQFLAIEYDYILFYTKKQEQFVINKMTVDTNKDKKYRYKDEYFEKRGKYYLRDLDYKGSYSTSLDYPIKLPKGKEIYPGGKFGKPNTWRWSKKKFIWGLKNGFIEIDDKKEKIYIKQYQYVDNDDNIRSRKIPYRALIKFINSEGAKEIASLLDYKAFAYPKPEKMMKHIFDIATQPKDIILDYHIGSGTTCAVAHKMDRQYIGIEQMDYIDNITVERLKKVIAGEQGGISKSVNWKGGGDFVYLELAKWNEEAKEKILKAKSLKELEMLFDELYERYFLNYNVKTKEFKEKTIREEGFRNLSLDEQKKLFVEMLDMNQMYVNFSERADKKYNLSKDDIALSEGFYNIPKK